MAETPSGRMISLLDAAESRALAITFKYEFDQFTSRATHLLKQFGTSTFFAFNTFHVTEDISLDTAFEHLKGILKKLATVQPKHGVFVAHVKYFVECFCQSNDLLTPVDYRISESEKGLLDEHIFPSTLQRRSSYPPVDAQNLAPEISLVVRRIKRTVGA